MNQRIQKGFLQQYGEVLVYLSAVIDALAISGFFYFICFVNGREFTQDFVLVLLATLLVYLGVGSFYSLYRSWRVTGLLYEILYVLGFWWLTFMAIGSLLYFYDDFLANDSDVLKFWFFFTPILLVFVRIVVRFVLQRLRIMGRNFRLVAIVGATDIGVGLERVISNSPWMGLKIVGFVDDRLNPKDGRIPEFAAQKLIGDVKTLKQKISNGEIDIVYIALPMRSQVRVKKIIDELSTTTASIYYAPDFDTFDLLHSRWDSIGGQPVVSIVETPFVGSMSLVKRIEDIVLSLLILSIIALPMLGIALAIRLTSKGPAIFVQKRYGLDGKPFNIWKFRSMYQSDQEVPFKQATKQDPRITPLGAILRKTSLDELPQVINVLQGRMSLVGPRPHPIALDDAHVEQINRYFVRYKVKPGITGWAQVNGFRGETDTLQKMEGRIAYDLEYINGWSVFFDIKILFMTFFKVMEGENAY